jgi:hypothetical protein
MDLWSLIIAAAAQEPSEAASQRQFWLTVAVAVISPGILALITSWSRRRDRDQEWGRQDKVKEQEQKDKEIDRQRQDEVARKADEVATQAREAARLVKASNEANAEAARVTKIQLDTLDRGQKVIHTLVNSNMTAEMQRGLIALKGQRVLMLRVMDLNKAAQHEPTPEDQASLHAMEQQIAELEATLQDRLKQTEVANAQAGEKP